jgi:hypothetical protein
MLIASGEPDENLKDLRGEREQVVRARIAKKSP